MKQFDSETTNMLFATTKRLALKKQTLVLFFSIFLTLAGFAADRYAVATGNWNASSTWSATSGGGGGASVPVAGDNVFIETGISVTLNVTGFVANITINSGGTLNVSGSNTLNVTGTWINDGAFNRSTGTVIFNGNIAQSIGGITSTYFHNLTINNTANIVTLNASTSLSATLNITTSSNFNLSSHTVNFNGASTHVFNGGFNAGTSTVNYTSGSGTIIKAAQYYNLSVVGTGGRFFENGLISIANNFITGTNGLTFNNSTIRFNGNGGAQTFTPTPALAMYNLTIDNPDGLTITNSNLTINNNLNFVNGKIIMGANTLLMGASSSVTGAGTGKYVNGRLRKFFATATASKTFEIGDDNHFAPVTLSFTGNTNSGGSMTMLTTSGDHPSISSSEINQTLSVNRFYTFINGTGTITNGLGSTGTVGGFSSYNATFNFDALDIDATANTNNFIVNRFASSTSTWFTPTIGTRTVTSTQITGYNLYGDFQVGEIAPDPIPCSFNSNTASVVGNIVPCIDNLTTTGNETIVSTSFAAGQYFTMDVIQGLNYRVYTANNPSPASPLMISVYNEDVPTDPALAFSFVNTGNAFTQPNNAYVTFTPAFSGRVRILINKRRDCSATIPTGIAVRFNIVGGSNTLDDQNEAGTDSWVGHIYEGTNASTTFNSTFTNYLGKYSEPELFNQNFGNPNNDVICFSVNSGSITRASVKIKDFAVRYRMNSTKRGLWIANIGSDDGSRLAVDGVLVYSDWVAQGYAPQNNILMNLTGSSNLQLDFYEGTSGNQVSFLGFTQVLANVLANNTIQTVCQGSTPNPISGDVFPTLPSGLSLPGYQWTYSTTPGGTRTNITGATAATFTPNTSVAPFNVAGTYYIYRNATLRSTNNISPNPYNATNESNAAILTVEASAPLQSVDINPTSLCYNSSTQITLLSSTVGINYQLRDNATNSPIGGVIAGTGAALNFNTGNILTTTTYNVLAINPVTSCTIQMLNTNTISINPGTEKTVTATPSLVCVGNSAKVTIGLSQPNVKYVLRNDADNSSLGDTLTGNGGNLEFNIPIGYLVTTTVFNVWAIDTITSCQGILINKVTITTQNFPSPVFDIEQDFCTLGQGQVILATTDSTFSGFLWSNGDPTPSIVIEQSGFYSLTVTDANGCRTTKSINIGDEKVINGDFSQGVGVGYTTGYILNQAPNGLVSPGIGYYAINTNANFTHGNFWGRDHTSQSGNFMIINGDGPARTIWQTTVDVVPNTRYYFSAWAMSVNNAGPFAQLQFNINGVNSGSSPVLEPGVNNNSNSGWQRFFGTWDSEALSGTITIRIVNLQGASSGNDFGIDDISFSTLPPVSFFGASVGNGGNNLCLNDTLKLTATLTGGANPITYSWTGPNGFTSSVEDPIIENAEGGWYYLTAVEGRNCQSTDSIFIILSDPIVTGVTQPGKCFGAVRVSVSGMVPNSLNNTIYYTVNNGAVRTATNIISDEFGNATFIPNPALGTTNNGQILRITGIFNGSCTKNFATPPQVVLDIKPSNAGWIGSTTGNWNDAANWCPGVPGTGTDVTIPTGVTVFVDDNEIANARNLTLSGTAILELRNNATFNFYGVFAGTGKIDARRGIVATRRNNANQDISGDFFVEKAVSTLVLANTGGTSNVTITGDTLKILSALEFGNTGADLVTSDKIVLVSSDTATASIGVIPGTGNAITGNFIVERYLINARKWRLLAAPTNRAGQTVRNSWQENGVNLPGYGFNAADPRYTPTNTLGFDFLGNNGSVKKYNPVTDNWDAVANTDVLPIGNERGYFVFVAGDRTVTFPGSKPTKLRTVGTINRGTQPAITVPANQFATVGNPYASRIDMRNINKSAQIADAFYVWDPSLGSYYGLGAFNTFFFDGSDYVNLLSSSLYGPAFTPNNFIESGMAVMVRNNNLTQSGTVTFEENDKIAGSNLSSFTSNGSHRLIANLKLAPQGSNPAILLDAAGAMFNESNTNDFNEEDLKKMGTVGETVSWKTVNNEVVVDKRFTPTFNDTLNLQIKQMRVQNYQWELALNNMDYPGLEAVLIDRYKNTRTALNMNGTTVVDFNIQNIPGSYAIDRFKIVFSPAVALPVSFTNIAAQRNTDRSVSVQWKVENEINMDGYQVERSANGTDFQPISSLVTPKNNNAGAAAYQYSDLDKISSDLFYRIKGISTNGEIQYSAIVKVGGFKTDALITVYPNPVQNKQMNVQFSAASAGNYQLTLLGNNGTRVLQQILKLNNNTSTQTIELPATLAAGRYQLQVISPDGKLQQQSVIVL